MEKRLLGHQIGLRDLLILFVATSCILGVTITRLQAFRALHQQIRLQSLVVFQLELDSQARGDDVLSDRIAQQKRSIARLEHEANRHITITFILLGVIFAIFALALGIARLWTWKARRSP